ncbi:MAG: hypothetical protein ACOX7F_03840 [Eubacteriales bacterium]|jgi:uncharacterized protein YndB with AHSA1/START domain
MASARKAEITMDFTSSRQQVWDRLTHPLDTSWREDVRWAEEVEPGKSWREYVDARHSSLCTIIRQEPCSVYEYRTENDQMTSHWYVELTDLPEGGCRVLFRQEMQLTSAFWQVASYFAWSLQAVLHRYVYQLKQSLGEK